MPAHQRYRAPAGNGEILAVPGFDAIPALVEENRRKLDRDDVIIGGLPLRELRKQARREILTLASGGREPPDPDLPLLLAGHQPELSHPGVWVKNFALHGLARKLGGIPLNLIVDNDTVKSTSLRFPVFEDRDPESVHLEFLSYDRLESESPYEWHTVADREVFRTFAAMAAALWKDWKYMPLLPDAWETAAGRGSPNLGENFTFARTRYEQCWDCQNLEYPVSSLGRSQAFWRFAWHIFADLPRFQEVYNNALRDYRKANGLKSENHPAPELKQKKQPDIWFESPFWGLNSSKLSRGRVWARVEDDYLDLWSEGVGIVKCLLYPGAPNEELADCCNCRIKLRPRALTLTLFARVCLGDFFIHGIGGGKYDEVTDAIIRDYFGIDPPAYQVLSATLHLPLPAFSSTDVDVKRLEHELRDLTWNPQRHLTAEALARPEVQRLVKEKRVLAAHEPPRGDHDARRDWFRRLQHVTEQLRPLVAEQVSKADANVRRARTEAHANAILQRRDYSWVLYPEETLRPFLQQFLSL